MTFNKTGELLFGLHQCKCGFWHFKMLLEIVDILTQSKLKIQNLLTGIRTFSYGTNWENLSFW